MTQSAPQGAEQAKASVDEVMELVRLAIGQAQLRGSVGLMPRLAAIREVVQRLAAPSVTVDERQAFEAWWQREGKHHSPRKENFYRAWQDRAALSSAPAQAAVAAGKATDAQILEWGQRHDLGLTLSELRCIFEDAQTLVPAQAASPQADEACADALAAMSQEQRT